MIVFPNAKINIGLYITSKRSDGYHNIETIFYPIMKCNDILEVINSPLGIDKFSCSGLKIDGKAEDNLCMKALRLMRQYAEIPPVLVHLHKEIPAGSGLGGGSADAAFMLKLLNQQYNINLSDFQLMEIASDIGADCSFFIKNQPVLARGIGNKFFDIQLSLKGLWILIVVPDLHINTELAYSTISLQFEDESIEEKIIKPVTAWQGLISNTFEVPLSKEYPIINKIREKMFEAGALYVSLSGSGAAIYGLFKSKPLLGDWSFKFKTHIERLV